MGLLKKWLSKHNQNASISFKVTEFQILQELSVNFFLFKTNWHYIFAFVYVSNTIKTVWSIRHNFLRWFLWLKVGFKDYGWRFCLLILGSFFW